MAPNVQPSLLIEIFEAIIDEASDNTTSLRHLSLTCRTILPRARYHLFSNIVIRTVQQMESSREFLDSRSWAAPLVRKVTLSIFVRPDNSIPNIRLLDAVPAQLLSRLPNLRTWRMGVENRFDMSKNTPAWLSFHRSALSCYRKHGGGGHIQNLELSSIPFDDISDFTGLISALKGIHSLTCSDITFRTAKEHNISLYYSGTSMRARALTIKSLTVNTSVDIRAIEYLLASSATTLNNLVLNVFGQRQVVLPQRDNHSFDFERLEKLVARLSQLSSLRLVIAQAGGIYWENHEGAEGPSIWQDIRNATKILLSVDRARLQEAQVEFKLDPIPGLGGRQSWDDRAWEACRGLEEALITFRLYHIMIRHPASIRRAGRAESWSPTVRRAFSKLNERGRLMFAQTKLDNPDLLGHQEDVTAVVASHDSKLVITASGDGTIIVWDAERGTIIQDWLAHRGVVCALALSPDSRQFVSAGGAGREALAVWDISDGIRRAAAPEGHTKAVTTCTWSPNGALIASASADGTVRIWDPLTFRQLDLLDDANAVSQPHRLQFSPDGDVLAWISESPTNSYGCYLWRPLSGKRPKMLPSHRSRGDIPINAFSFDPKSVRIATAHGHWRGQPEDHVVRIWDVASGAALHILAGHLRNVLDVSFSPDGTFVLSASVDGSARIWDVESGRETVTIKDDGGSISNACFSPNGKHVTTISENKVGLWRARNGSCATMFTESRSVVRALAFTPNGEFLASGGFDGVVHIRRLSTSVGLGY